MEAFESTWNLIKRQSERQFGAFVFAYLQQFNRPPSVIENKKVEFRNNVIHKGQIPTKEEALGYGQSVLDIIQPQLSELREVAIEAIHGEIQSGAIEKSKHMVGYPRTNAVAPSVISCIHHAHEIPNLKDVLECEPRFRRINRV